MRKHNQELEIDEDIKFERKTWVVQRISWVIMFLIVLAAILGFTGRGGILGINKQKVTTASGAMEVEYERYQRRQALGELKINLKDIRNPSPAITFTKKFYESQRVEQVVPEPKEVKVSSDGITYIFSAGSSQSKIIFYVQSQTVGTVDFSIQSPDGNTVAVNQFVYP